MMSEYIEAEMVLTACGIGGSFSAKASFCLDNFKAPFYDIEVKIDTGCSISAIPLKRLRVSDALCKTLKKIDIINQVPYFLSYGIESGGNKHDIPITDDDKMRCPVMKFEHGVSDFMIGGVKISSDRVCLNYDRKGNVLIGMDILRDWDIHIGVSNVTGKNLLLACPMESDFRGYVNALKRHFGLY